MRSMPSATGATRSWSSTWLSGPEARRPGRSDRIRRVQTPAERWDIFCRVVDNAGDVAVSWRLARQLAREHGKLVRLWLDDLTVLAKLRPEIDPAYDVQRLDGVEVARIREPFVVDAVGDVV